MSEQLVISPANLNIIETKLGELVQGIDQVNGKVESVAQEVSATQDNLARLADEFRDFVIASQRSRKKQEALTEINTVKLDVQAKYGRYQEIRDLASGLVKAIDTRLVRAETLRFASEERLTYAKQYWLGPGIVAISAWWDDNRRLAEMAVKEALNRDDNKATLFFALMARRTNRRQASGAWLRRFFSLQDPTSLDRELVVLINAVANGIFGPEGRGLCSKQFEEWLKELSERAGFVDRQRARWADALVTKQPSLNGNEYPYLRKHCPAWGQLEASLCGSRFHKALRNYFEGIFTAPPPTARGLADEVDKMLDQLVSENEKEELVERRKLLRLELIRDADGDEDAAMKRFESVKKALDSRDDFTQMITNTAMQPELAGANVATQRLAISLSRDWIVAAHDDVTAKIRLGLPAEIPIKIDSWEGKTRDGQNEADLVSLVDTHLRSEEAKRVTTIVLKPANWVALVLGGIVALYGLFTLNWFLIIVGLVGVGWYFYAKWQLDQNKVQVHQHYENLRDTTPKILKAVLAEVVDWRKDYATGDSQAEDLRKYLQSITTEEHLLTTFDSGRAAITN